MLERQLHRREPFADDEEAVTVAIDTSTPVDATRIAKAWRDITAAAA